MVHPGGGVIGLHGPALQMAVSLGVLVLLFGYTWLVWGRRPHARLTEAAAMAHFRQEHDGCEPLSCLVLEDGGTALIRLRQAGRLGVVSRFGRRWITRVLELGDVRRLRRDHQGATHLTLNDYAHPRLRLRFPTRQAEAEWLGGLVEPL